jgi:glycosyltransferase involved in cell wall biosynthesis
MQMLKIGINALYLLPGQVGGTEIYLRSLLAALAEIDPANRYFVFTNRETGANLVPQAPNFEMVPQAVRAAVRPARMVWEQTVLPLSALDRGLDVMLNPGFTMPLFASCPQVTVFHDMQHKRHPEYFRWFDLPFWRFFLFWSAHLSRFVIAPSRSTAADLIRYYRLPSRKVRITPSGVDPVFFELGRRRRPEPMLLSVSTLHPHKNLDELLRTFAAYRKRRPEFRLVVCGLHGFYTETLLALRESLGLQGAVEFPGWIPREKVHDLFTRAWAFFYPSLFEGFGLPVLEALAAGIPTVCSAIAPLSTIVETAAVTFDPQSPQAFLDAMQAVVEDEALRSRLTEEGPRRAAEFSWKDTARNVLAVLREAAN